MRSEPEHLSRASDPTHRPPPTCAHNLSTFVLRSVLISAPSVAKTLLQDRVIHNRSEPAHLLPGYSPKPLPSQHLPHREYHRREPAHLSLIHTYSRPLPLAPSPHLRVSASFGLPLPSCAHLHSPRHVARPSPLVYYRLVREGWLMEKTAAWMLHSDVSADHCTRAGTTGLKNGSPRAHFRNTAASCVRRRRSTLRRPPR